MARNTLRQTATSKLNNGGRRMHLTRAMQQLEADIIMPKEIRKSMLGHARSIDLRLVCESTLEACLAVVRTPKTGRPGELFRC